MEGVGGLRSFIAPAGATRILFGVQDFNGCYSPNTGSFSATVTTLSSNDLIPQIHPGDPFAVPATSSPCLAGAPAGTRLSGACSGGSLDSAPSNSPIEVELPNTPNQAVQIIGALGRVAVGTAADGPSWISVPPDGNGRIITSTGSFGISSLIAPGGALVGVFLGNSPPNPSLRPPDLDFTGGLRDLLILQPMLQQQFYIGSGQAGDGNIKGFIVPAGATRLLLGVQDYSGCYSPNTGSFTLSVTALPADDVKLPSPVQLGETFSVPAIADLALAGEPAGARLTSSCTPSSLDSAPSNSPIEVQLPSQPRLAIQVTNVLGRVATGTAADGPIWISIPPEGNSSTVALSASFGLSNLKAPGGALVGVFLRNQLPNPGIKPPDLDFSGGLRELTYFSSCSTSAMGAPRQALLKHSSSLTGPRDFALGCRITVDATRRTPVLLR